MEQIEEEVPIVLNLRFGNVANRNRVEAEILNEQPTPKFISEKCLENLRILSKLLGPCLTGPTCCENPAVTRFRL